MNNRAFYKKNFILIILIAVSLLLLLLGFYHIYHHYAFVKEENKVTAEIKNILSYPDANSENYKQELKEYNALLKEYREKGIIRETSAIAIIIGYTVDGKTYLKELGYFSDEMYIGQDLTIYINKNNPENFVYNGGSKFGLYFCMIVGAGLLIVCSIMLFINKYNSKCDNVLLEKGKMILAEILYADEDESRTSFEKHPFIFTCVYKNEETNEEKYFTSERVYCKNNGLSYIGEKVKVYVDPNNYDNYYIDVKGFEK